MRRTVAIIQSNYLPWRGYFDLMRRCDLFVIGDTVKYTKEDWRNRNVIKTASGLRWLTIPVHYRLRETTPIDHISVADDRWARKHIAILRQHYGRAAAYREVSTWLFPLLESLATEQLLSKINVSLVVEIAARLGITTPVVQSADLVPRDLMDDMEKNARTIAICRAAGATHYLTGPAARAYLDEALFRAVGIDVVWMSYEGYPAYPQLWGSFEPRVSIVDLLFNTGSAAGAYIGPGDGKRRPERPPEAPNPHAPETALPIRTA